MAQALSDIYNSLNAGGYDQQRGVINNQLGAVDSQTQGVLAGLNTQKDQAFQGITNQANNNGMFYSGAPIQEEQKYTGGTFLPAVANVQTQAQNQKFGLQQALAGVNTAQTGAAQGIYQNQVQNDQQNNYYAQQLAQQKAYNDQMAQMYSRQSGGYSGGGGGGAAPSYSATHNGGGGWNFTSGGQPITAAQYAAANGTTVQALLSQGSAGDRQIAQQIANARTPQQQAALKSKYSYIFGGV